MTKSDRLTYAVLALAFLLLIFALVGVIIWADSQIQIDQRHVDEIESELADTRAELGMWQRELTALVEGDVNFELRGPSEED
ncbi:MAG: hypothetical protein ACYDH3_00125 [Candidatus Aminicenantales bacterium]